ncbi:MAG: chromosome segregation protein SMC [Alphaproteobacteria bacterium]|nr:chromosome segregation protein SMC [Alphaproteobacteria bacterium]
MQFTKLKLVGFKSFVEPTEVPIGDGLTGIVGPNGCGKSNIVEAVRWVMGETSPKQMRGGGMEDVIFAGTEARPARNVAEVHLLLDNAAGTAPAAVANEPEIDISRRIERGMGSLYRVNGRETRARDVQTLFADSATGARSTAMVSQGRVGALVNAKPDERRMILEEAAGITGLHARRHEAELRLRAAEQNLLRADDVLNGLETQLQGLKRQARQAARYRSISEHIRNAEARLLAIRLARGWLAETEAAARLAETEARVAEAAAAATHAAAIQAEAASTLPPLRSIEAEAAAALQRRVIEREQIEAEEKRAIQGLAEAEARLAQIEADTAREQALRHDAEAADARLAAERDQIALQQAGEPARLIAARTTRDAVASAVAALEAEAAALTEQVAEISARANALGAEIGQLDSRRNRLGQQAETLAREKAEAEARLIEAARLDAAAAETEATSAALAAARNEVEAAEAARGTAQSETAASVKAQHEAEAARAKLAAEAQGLAALLAVKDNELWPPMIDAVAVPAGLETALGAAFGEDLDASGDEAAAKHWRTLPALDPAQALPEGTEPLAGHIAAPAALARALGQIGLVADAAQGDALMAQLRPGQRLVSRDGALWRWDGYRMAAGAPTAAAIRLQQRNRLATVRTALAEAETALTAARATREAAAAREAQAALREQQARQARRAAEGDYDRARHAHASLSQQATAASARLGTLSEQAGRIAADQAEVEAALARARAAQAELPPLDAARARLAEARTRLSDARTSDAQARSLLAAIEREAAEHRRRADVIARELASWQSRAAGAARRLADLAQRHALAAEARDAIAALPGELAARRNALMDDLAEAESSRRKAMDALASAELALSAADRDLRAREQEAAATREDRVRAEAAVQQARQAVAELGLRIVERLALSAAELAAEQAEDLPEPTPEAEEHAGKRLERLIKERDGMGPVNLRAEVEAQEIETQIDTLTTERADLTAAIAKLRAGIGALNREGRERLLASFAVVDKHFQELFTRLFGGGSAHLKLIDSDDPLEAGLEIMASPPGKKLTTLSLLSGGEQALTALSLIFAVFLTNPAPICVLDEVDAPLDDANVDRFCTLLEEIAASTRTRFLIVTHHRMTMARMHRLFGVTMPERGISQLVSVDLGRAEELAGVAQAQAAE